MGSLPEFPDGFVVGVSTAAYQIEGAVGEGGRGRSVWDTFAHTPGRTRDGDTGDVACDHYHRWGEDVALMAELGVDAYRFSIAWPRIQPDGTGKPNPDGLDFYDRLVDALQARGIAAIPTLFHWDLPQALEDRGGWLSRETSERFGEYAGHVADRLGDRVRTWITLNEPIVHMAQGYAFGDHAPGRQLGFGALPVAHHQLLGHGLAVQALRSRGAPEVMLTNNCTPVRPASDDEADVAAAAVYDGFHNRLFNEPVLIRKYPEFLVDFLDPVIRDGDLDVIGAPPDALGINYYNPTLIGALRGGSSRDGTPPGGTPAVGDSALDGADSAVGDSAPGGADSALRGADSALRGADSALRGADSALRGADSALRGGDALPFELRPILGVPTTAFGWPVAPDGLHELLTGFNAKYHLPPVYITENGCSTADVAADAFRIDYLGEHLHALHRAIADGVDVRGYFVWSLLDNFEWAEGYSQRFGLVRVDFETQERSPRDSFRWLQSALAGR